MISCISNYIKHTPYDNSFFKCIMLLPIVGHIAQIWKRSFLLDELTEEKSKVLPNPGSIRKLTRDIAGFDTQSLCYGMIGDIGYGMIGDVAGVIIATSPGASSLILFGMASLLFRSTIMAIDRFKQIQYNS
jgi:hypothetical protein